MLNRQKAIVQMLARAERAVSRLELTKWCFLLRRETASHGGGAFYQFVPHRYGPFSFCLYREADILARSGLLIVSDDKTWKASVSPSPGSANLPACVERDIAEIVRRFVRTPAGELIEYVYRQYPWFTVNSELDGRERRPVAKPAVYTVGYEGQSIDGFLNTLVYHGIRRAVDVRYHPVSRRYGFHKSTLARLCENLSIAYVHTPELGIPSEKRRRLQTGADYTALLDSYQCGTLHAERASVRRVSTLVAREPSALMCMEADPERCHRTRLAGAIAKKTGLPIRHLEGVE